MKTCWWVWDVKDTRTWVEGKPLPGSGDFLFCDQCGANHQIHVDVREVQIIPGEMTATYRLTGRQMTVGQTCAKKLGARPKVPGMKRAS